MAFYVNVNGPKRKEFLESFITYVDDRRRVEFTSVDGLRFQVAVRGLKYADESRRELFEFCGEDAEGKPVEGYYNTLTRKGMLTVNVPANIL